MPGKLDDHDLHTQTDAEVGDFLLPGKLGCQNHALDAPSAKAAGDDNTVQPGEGIPVVGFRQGFGIDPENFNVGIQSISRVAQSLCHGQIGIVELNIFAHQTDGDGFAPVVDPLHQCLPLLQLRLRGGDPQLPADDTGKVLFFQHQGSLVQVGQGDVFNDAVGLDIAEQADFLEDAVLQGLVAAQNHDVRLDTHALQLPDGVLGGLGFVLVGATEEGHQRHMDEQTVLLAHLQRNLPDSLQKGLGLDIADGAADFGDYHIGVRLLAHPVDEFLDFIGDMGNDLNGGAKVFPPALLVQHIPVDLTRGQVGKLVQILVDEPLIVT